MNSLPGAILRPHRRTLHDAIVASLAFRLIRSGLRPVAWFASRKLTVIATAGTLGLVLFCPPVEAGLVDWVMTHTPGGIVLSKAIDRTRTAILLAFDFIWQSVKTIFEQVALPALNQLGTWGDAAGIDLQSIFAQVGGLLAAGDHWFPVTETMFLLAAFYAWAAALVLIKWAIKICPFVGG